MDINSRLAPVLHPEAKLNADKSPERAQIECRYHFAPPPLQFAHIPSHSPPNSRRPTLVASSLITRHNLLSSSLVIIKTIVMAEELWRHPDPTSTPMWKFIQRVNDRHQLEIKGYQDLYKWSIDNVGLFWEECWEFVGIQAELKGPVGFTYS